jgi:hypothetical protein
MSKERNTDRRCHRGLRSTVLTFGTLRILVPVRYGGLLERSTEIAAELPPIQGWRSSILI